MAAPRGRQITSFGGFFDPFAIGSASLSTRGRVTLSERAATITPSEALAGVMAGELASNGMASDALAVSVTLSEGAATVIAGDSI